MLWHSRVCIATKKITRPKAGFASPTCDLTPDFGLGKLAMVPAQSADSYFWSEPVGGGVAAVGAGVLS